MRLAVPCKLRVLTALIKDILQFRQFNLILIIYGAINISKFVGLSMMCYRLGKEKRMSLGDRQLRGRMGKLLYCLCLTAS